MHPFPPAPPSTQIFALSYMRDESWRLLATFSRYTDISRWPRNEERPALPSQNTQARLLPRVLGGGRRAFPSRYLTRIFAFADWPALPLTANVTLYVPDADPPTLIFSTLAFLARPFSLP